MGFGPVLWRDNCLTHERITVLMDIENKKENTNRKYLPNRSVACLNSLEKDEDDPCGNSNAAED